MTTPRRGLVAAVLACALALPLAGAPQAMADGHRPVTAATAGAGPAAEEGPKSSSRLQLPVPSGTYAVGQRTLQLTDTARKDPWKPESGPRRLMTTLYYPAARGTGSPRAASYMTEREARAMIKSWHREAQLSPAELAGTRTHARTGALPAGGKHPLVVLSPGFGMPRATMSVTAEELASRGYAVAAVDHAYESVGTEFTDGRFTDCAACQQLEKVKDKDVPRFMSRVTKGRSRDVSFLLDELLRRYPQVVDARRIGMAGHSIGGSAAARTMRDDPRVRAGVNLDGTFFSSVPREGLDGRPFLMLGAGAGHMPGGEDGTWSSAWKRLDGWKRWLTVSGGDHMTFTDMPVLSDQLGIENPEAPLSGDRSARITRSYVGAFFDQHLRGITPQPLLEGPTKGNPEVRFHNP
ncbi:alpha/beta hydrolase [Streptomyces sp. ODS28]|uniref:alpha/beta hydrolase family protein n=1 Tax=Streptomyces sp. ODS28 TaxID=3136688 RepID=UPI0031E918B3